MGNRITEYRAKIKIEVLTHYSGTNPPQCKDIFSLHPNEVINDTDLLTIDHINGGGRKHSEEIKRNNLYVWLRNNNYPDGFQVLCWNCQAKKRYVNGESRKTKKFAPKI